MSTTIIVSILFLSAFLSGISVFFVKKNNDNFLKLILSFSGAFLFAITVLHLIPHVYYDGNTQPEIIGLYILGGFLFQLLMEQFSQGIEHGHIHHDKHAQHVFPLGILISLCLHAFLEGMPLVLEHQSELVFGIAIHHIPAAFALGSLLLYANLSKSKMMLYIGVFAAMTPLGYLTSKFLSTGEMTELANHFDKIMAIVIGIFLHISTTILFESGSADHHKFNKKKMIAIVLGIAVSLTNFLFDSHQHGPAQPQHKHEHHNHSHDHDHQHNHDHHEHDHHH